MSTRYALTMTGTRPVYVRREEAVRVIALIKGLGTPDSPDRLGSIQELLGHVTGDPSSDADQEVRILAQVENDLLAVLMRSERRLEPGDWRMLPQHYWNAMQQHRSREHKSPVGALATPTAHEHVGGPEGSPVEGANYRATNPVLEAAVPTLDDPNGSSDNTPSISSASVAGPKGVMDSKHTLDLPFDDELFARIAADYSSKVVAQAKRLLLASDEIRRAPGKYFVGLTHRIGGRPPGASVMPDADDLEALSRLVDAYHRARAPASRPSV